SRASHLPAALCETILEGAGGNPFYIEELIKVLIEKEVIVTAPNLWRIQTERLALAPVSPSLNAVLRAGLDGLPSVERSLLQAASVVGHVFWDSALCPPGLENQDSVSGLETALDSLCRKELIHRREFSGFTRTVEYSFKHELLRNVAYDE